MTTRLQDYRMLWRAATAQAHPFNSALVLWGAPLVVLAFTAAEWHAKGAVAGLAWLWRALCILVLLDWTWRFIPGAVKLAMPADAKLVPRVRRRLAELSCLVWCAAVAALCLMPFANANGMVLLWIAGFTLGGALAAAGHAAGVPTVFTVFFAGIYFSDIPEAVQLLASRPAVWLPLLLLAAGAAVLVTRAIFPEAGERHWRMVARRTRVANRDGKPDPMLGKLGGGRARDWYAGALRGAGARRDSRRLVLHALGPSHHLSELAIALGMVILALLAVAALHLWRTGDLDVVAGIGWLVACVLLLLPLATSLRLSGLAAQHSAEQALVRLAPAMPGTPPSFNRHLGRALLVLALKGWALASAAALLLPLLGGADLATMLRQACICLLTLPVVAAPLRNHAQRAPHAMVERVVLLLALFGASLGAGFAARTFAGLPVMPVAAGVALLASAWAVIHGLRVMERSPFAFPAARLD